MAHEYRIKKLEERRKEGNIEYFAGYIPSKTQPGELITRYIARIDSEGRVTVTREGSQTK